MPNAVATDPMTTAREAVRKITSIATLPEVTAKIIRTVEDPKSSATQLHKIVLNDPALVTRVLKVVNSSFYGLSGQIGSIERAIVLLGANAVKNIAVAASIGQLFRGAKLCEGFTAKDLWKHCIAVAVVSRELAKEIKPALAEEAFLSGMIHDTGMLVSMQLSPETVRDICETARLDGRAFCDIELEKLGTTHQHLGLALTEQWKFPLPCQLAAGYHHNPAEVDEALRPLVSLVAAADVICCQTKHGFNLTALNQTLESCGAIDFVNAEAATKVAARLDVIMNDCAMLMG